MNKEELLLFLFVNGLHSTSAPLEYNLSSSINWYSHWIKYNYLVISVEDIIEFAKNKNFIKKVKNDELNKHRGKYEWESTKKYLKFRETNECIQILNKRY